MIFENLSAINFRNFDSRKFSWSTNLNLIIGKNASGKTNLLEAFSILSGWGAFGKIRDLQNWNHSMNQNTLLNANIGQGVRSAQNLSSNIQAKISSQISLRFNEKRISSTELRLEIPTIFFSPTSVNLIDGAPSIRRSFLNKLCALIFPAFAKRLSEFRFITRNRIDLLRKNLPASATDIPFCKLGGWIMDARRRVLTQISHKDFTLKLFPEIPDSSSAEFLFRELQRTSQRERYALHPIVGANYDDLQITLNSNSKPAAIALSRGQKRKLTLELIISAAELIAKTLGKNPVLFFDDLFAELDPENRAFSFKKLAQTNWQCFVTSPENFSAHEKYNCEIFKLEIDP